MTISTTTTKNQHNGNASATTFAYNFKILDQSHLEVIKTNASGVDTTLSITTHYTVSGVGNDTGSITYPVSGSPLASGEKITIRRKQDFLQATDLQNQGGFFAEVHETAFDKQTQFALQNQEELDRTLRGPVTDPTSSDMTLPNKDTRKGTVLGFNATSGNPEAGPKIADVSTLASITADIATLADIEDGTDATDTIQTVAGIASNVSSVAGISSNVTAVAGNATNINAVAGNATNINAVAADATDIGAVAAKATQIGLLGTSDAIADMNTLGTSAIVADMAILGTADVVADMNTLAHADVVSDMNTLATSDIISDLNTLASSAIVDDLNILATSANVTNMATLGASGVVSDIATLSNIQDGTSYSNGITTVAGISSNVTTVAGAASAVSTVASAIANVNTTASNITGVNSFAARYRVASSAPTSDLDEGDLYFNTSANALYYYNGSAWVIIATYTHPNHTGEVTSTGDGATVIADNVVDEANLKVSNTPTNGYVLTAQSGASGGLTWAADSTTDSTKLPLAGGTMTGDLILGDDVKLEVGDATGGDLQVWHDGTNSHIKNTTGTLFINSDGMTKLQDAGANETFAVFNDNGASELYHDNSKKIETTANGVTVTGGAVGTMTTDNDGSFSMSASNNFKCTPTGNFTLTFTNIVAQSGNILLVNSGGHTVAAHANTKVNANLLATVSTAGTYLLSYFSDGTNVYMTNSAIYT